MVRVEIEDDTSETDGAGALHGVSCKHRGEGLEPRVESEEEKAPLSR
jgi:hypothetical protein